MDMTWLIAVTGTTYLKLRRQYSKVGSTYRPKRADSSGRRSTTSSFSIQLSTACAPGNLSVQSAVCHNQMSFYEDILDQSLPAGYASDSFMVQCQPYKVLL